MAQTGQRVDPYRNFNFLVELDGIAARPASPSAPGSARRPR